MKLTVQQVMDAVLTLSTIIRESRPMPTKGRYRMARLHAKLLPEFQTINSERDKLITAYNHHEMIKTTDNAGVETETPAAEFSVPVEKMPEFTEAWKKIASEEIEVDAEPIPLAYLDLGDNVEGSIQSNEFIVLGPLVKE